MRGGIDLAETLMKITSVALALFITISVPIVSVIFPTKTFQISERADDLR
jgi:hypothetical protein